MPDQKMNYESMENMAKAFDQAAQQIETTQGQMSQVSKTLSDGALTGQAGDALVSAINDKLTPALNKIRDQMSKLGQDIRQAEQATKDAVDAAAKGFN